MSTDSNNEKPSILKSTREAKGMTLEIVHEATKIPMDALRAIEEGYKVRILSPFYYRGFIKIYAEFLGLDPREMIQHYGLDQSTKPVITGKPPLKPSKPAQVDSGPNPLIEGIQEGFSVIFKPKTFKFILKIIVFAALIFALFKMAGCVATHLSKKRTPSKRQTMQISSSDAVKPRQETRHESSVQAQSEDNKVEVAVRASKDTWMRVKTDDQVVFQTTLSKGSMETWTANDRIELSGRDLEQLDMEVNNKQIGFLGGGDRRIKKVLITPEGLTVKK